MSNPQIFFALSGQIITKADVDLSILSDFLASQFSVGDVFRAKLAHLV